GDEDRQGVDERAAGVDRRLGVELGRLLGPDRQVADHHVGTGGAQGGGDVDGWAVGLVDDLAVVVPEPVQGGSALDRHPGGRDVTELDRVVLAGRDRLGQV